MILVRLISLLIVLACSVMPAFAGSYLIFADGQDRSRDVWQGNQPVAGQNVPVGSIVKSWTIVDGDTYPGNYQLVDGVVVHSVPVVEAPPVDPNTPQWEIFKVEVFQDNAMSLFARVELSKMYPLMDDNVTKPQLFQAFWAGMKAIAPSAYPWLDADTIMRVEAHATARKIPFVAE